MAIGGSLIGGMIGLSLGGPFGMLLGSLIGGKISRSKSRSGLGTFAQPQQIFALSLIVLSAKLSKVDGQVSKEELVAVKDKLRIPDNEIDQVGKIFNKAKEESTGYEPYAQQIAQLFYSERPVMEEILGALFHIAKADGVIHPAEIELLMRIAMIFGFDSSAFERLKHIHLNSGDEEDPYEILDIDHDVSDEVVKRAYRKLIRENHPDTLMAQGVPQEFIDLANAKMATINAAYDRIEKQRGMK